MEDDEPKSPSLPEPNGYLQRLTDNHQEFQQYVDEITEAVDQDVNFREMTFESYDEKKSYIKSHILELSVVHNSLVDQFSYLIEQVSNNCPSLLQDESLESDSSLQDSQMPDSKVSSHTDAEFSMSSVNYKVLNEKISDLEKEAASLKQKVQILTVESNNCSSLLQDEPSESDSSLQDSEMAASKFRTSTGFELFWNSDGGGFILSKSKESSHTDAEFSMPSVNYKVLNEKISDLEEEVASLKQKVQILTIESNNCSSLLEDEPSESDSSLQDSEMAASKFRTSTGYELFWNPDGGGFILSKSKESSDTGAECSMSSVNNDAVKLEETNKVLNEKISNLEEEVASLKQKVEMLTVENGELKQEVEDNITDIIVYINESKMEAKALEEELKASKEFAKAIDKHMCRVIAEKISGRAGKNGG